MLVEFHDAPVERRGSRRPSARRRSVARPTRARRPVQAARRVDGRDRLLDGCRRGSRSRRRGRSRASSRGGRDHRRAAGHRLDDAEAERLVEVDQVQERPRAAEQLAAPSRPDRADVAHALAVDMRLDELLEVVAVLDDPGDHERQAGALGDLDRLRGALVRMDPPEEEQIVARLLLELELAAARCRGGSWRRSRGSACRSASLIAT